MLEYIKGTLMHTSPSLVVIDTHGLGYRLHIPFNHYAKLPQQGTQVLFFVSTVIREDSHKLFGFLTQHERDLFEDLIRISGIGPKTAIALIGHMELHDLQTAINQNNITQVCKIPGIGKKTAERLIIEMRGKVFTLSEKEALSSPTEGQNRLFTDAISALVNLGYNAAQAQKAVKTASKTMDAEPQLASLITCALRSII